MADSDAVILGPGILRVAPIGTTEPTSASATPNAAFRDIGYTEDGSAFDYELTNEPIEVAEEFDPVKYATTARRSSVTFQMAEMTKANLALALNDGAAETNNAVAYEPPDPGDEVRVMLLWDGDEGQRWLFRQCFQGDSISIQRRKAPQKGLIPVTFRLEKPTGAAPFKVFPNADGLV